MFDDDDTVIYDDGLFRVEEVGDASTAQHCPVCNEWERLPIKACECRRWVNRFGGIEEPGVEPKAGSEHHA